MTRHFHWMSFRQAISTTAIVFTFVVVSLSNGTANAVPPGGNGNGNGGGGSGGGGSTSPARFSIIEIPVDGDPLEISDPGPDGLVTIAIESAEAGYGSAAFATVNATDGSVVNSGFLPEPPFVDPNDGVIKNGGSSPTAVNVYGDIVGSAATVDPDSSGSSSVNRAIVWSDDGTGFAYTLLPMLAGATESLAFGINNHGDIVGNISDGGYGIAVLWDAETLTPVDLNTVEIADQGWQLVMALDINDAEQIVGFGLLNEVFRGFLLDNTTGEIWTIPLVGPATENNGWRISETGRVIGDAWESNGNPWGSNPDYHVGFSWDGPGTNPVVLTSVVAENTLASGMNDLGATAGNSIIPTDEQFADDLVATLWEPDDQGNIQATELQETIPTNSEHTLLRAHSVNNDGWVTVYGRKRGKSKAIYLWRALVLVPTAS